jgi:hypothetical protein
LRLGGRHALFPPRGEEEKSEEVEVELHAWPTLHLRGYVLTVEEREAALLEDYKLKVSASIAQTERIQTQFQVMLTLESAIATTLIVTNNGNLTKNSPFIAGLLFALSVAWLIVGWTGRNLARDHRDAAADAGRLWADKAGLDPYAYVGQKPGSDDPPVPIVGVLAPAALTLGWLVCTIAFWAHVYG